MNNKREPKPVTELHKFILKVKFIVYPIKKGFVKSSFNFLSVPEKQHGFSSFSVDMAANDFGYVIQVNTPV